MVSLQEKLFRGAPLIAMLEIETASV